MPVQTRHPGVYIEERPSGVRTIVGVSTSVTAFVGATRMGPTATPVRIRSVADYVRSFGPPLDEASPLGHCVSHFFANGGSEAIVLRVAAADADTASVGLEDADTPPNHVLTLDAASPGAWAGNGGAAGLEAVVDYASTANPDDLFTLVLRLRGIDPRTGATTVLAEETHANLSMSPLNPRFVATALAGSELAVVPETSPAPGGTAVGSSLGGAELTGSTTITSANNTLRIALNQEPSVDVTIAEGASMNRPAVATAVNAALAAAGLAITASIDSNRLRLESDDGGPNSAVVVTPAPSDAAGTLHLGLAHGGTELSGSASLRPASQAWPFAGGADGTALSAGDIVPGDESGGVFALRELLFPRFNLLCLPGVTSDSDQDLGRALDFCEEERAFLLVDTPDGWETDPPDVGGLPALGEHGAIYYPRLSQSVPAPGGATATLDLPPSGAVAGAIARIDAERGIWKAPAGLEAGLVGFGELTEVTDDAVSDVLNPRGVNVLRTFPGAGTVVWGARTLKGDDTQASEFKYVPVRRLTDFIASSLYLGTQFAVFEPNDPDLWAQLRLAVGAFMRGLFRQGAFQQSAQRAESDSFFVVCDETVNPQSEVDLGRVNVVVGFAPLKPAEFVVITITQISQLEE